MTSEVSNSCCCCSCCCAPSVSGIPNSVKQNPKPNTPSMERAAPTKPNPSARFQNPNKYKKAIETTATTAQGILNQQRTDSNESSSKTTSSPQTSKSLKVLVSSKKVNRSPRRTDPIPKGLARIIEGNEVSLGSQSARTDSH